MALSFGGFCCSFFLNAQSYDNDIHLDVGSAKLSGTMIEAKRPNCNLALIIAGSGKTDRDGNTPFVQTDSLKKLAEGLEEKGVSSIRYDKRGVGKSKLRLSKNALLTFEDYVSDAISWIKYVKKTIPGCKISLIGHSEGALIAFLAAQNESVSSIISIASPGGAASLLLRRQLKSLKGVTSTELDEIISSIENGFIHYEVPHELSSILNVESQPYLISWVKYNANVELKKLEIPVLAIHGSKDSQVPITELSALVNGTSAKTAILTNMNHTLKLVSRKSDEIASYIDPSIPIHNLLVENVYTFMVSIEPNKLKNNP